jgi:tetratricopeptide (TPR) repeat protein
MWIFLILAAAVGSGTPMPDLEKARDRQDRSALDKMVNDARAVATKQSKDANAQYRLALAQSYAAEVAVELRDKPKGRAIAEAGVASAEKAISLKGDYGEYHRLLGTLCGQMISSAGLLGLKYGKCALTEINRAIELDPKSSKAYVAHGVGNYYLPTALGGGYELAVKDFRKAITLDAKDSEAWLWLGIALRKLNQNAEAHKALAKSLELNPNRIWTKQQLDKTPVK